MADIKLEFTGQAQDINDFNFALFEANSLGTGTKKEIAGVATLTMLPMMVRKAYGIPRVLEIILSAEGSVAAGIAANYIYDKLKAHHGEKLDIKINRREVHLDNGEITKVIEEEIKLSSKHD